jgi:hypothetical protein
MAGAVVFVVVIMVITFIVRPYAVLSCVNAAQIPRAANIAVHAFLIASATPPSGGYARAHLATACTPAGAIVIALPASPPAPRSDTFPPGQRLLRWRRTGSTDQCHSDLHYAFTGHDRRGGRGDDFHGIT